MFFNFLALHDDSPIKVSLITVKSTPQDSISESVVWKINLLVFAKTSIKINSNLHSCMRNEQWIFYDNLSVFGQIKKYMNK